MVENKKFQSDFRDDDTTPDVSDLHAFVHREDPEPDEGYESVPVFAWMVIFGILLFAVFYQGKYGGEINSATYVPWRGQGGIAAPKGPPNGATVFATRCASCHQAKGEGVPGMYPPLQGGELVVGNPEATIRVLLQGLQGPLVVKGATYNGAMPNWGDKLSDEEIAVVITHIRSSWGNSASPVSASDVATVRKATADRKEAWTAAELASLKSAPPATAKAEAAKPEAATPTPASK